MQYISTEYRGPSNFRGSRIIARTSYGKARVTVPYDHALTTENNHRAAAQALAKKLNWHGKWVEGGGERGNVYIRLMAGGCFNDGFTVQGAI